MNVLRKIFLTLVVMGFGGLLLLNSFVWMTRLTIMDRNVTQGWLSKSKTYDNFVDELAKTVEKEVAKRGDSGKESEGSVDVTALTRAAKAAFPPEVLKSNVESILNSAYDWLEGKTDKLVFNLDLTEEKQKFVDALGNEAVTKLSSLPACTSEQISEDFDPFSAGCLPSGTDISAQAEKLKTEIANSKEVLPDTQLTGEDIKVEVNGKQQTLDEAFSSAPKWYGWFGGSPIVLAVLVVINAGLIVLLSQPKRHGLKILAWFFCLVGTFLLLVGLTGTFVGNQLQRGSFKVDSKQGIADNLLVPLVKQVSSSLSTLHLIFASIYILLAIAAVVLYHILKKGMKPLAAPQKAPATTNQIEKPVEVKTPPKIQ